jgi:predicted transcriptional regulator
MWRNYQGTINYRCNNVSYAVYDSQNYDLNLQLEKLTSEVTLLSKKNERLTSEVSQLSNKNELITVELTALSQEKDHLLYNLTEQVQRRNSQYLIITLLYYVDCKVERRANKECRPCKEIGRDSE